MILKPELTRQEAEHVQQTIYILDDLLKHNTYTRFDAKDLQDTIDLLGDLLQP